MRIEINSKPINSKRELPRAKAPLVDNVIKNLTAFVKTAGLHPYLSSLAGILRQELVRHNDRLSQVSFLGGSDRDPRKLCELAASIMLVENWHSKGTNEYNPCSGNTQQNEAANSDYQRFSYDCSSSLAMQQNVGEKSLTFAMFFRSKEALRSSLNFIVDHCFRKESTSLGFSLSCFKNTVTIDVQNKNRQDLSNSLETLKKYPFKIVIIADENQMDILEETKDRYLILETASEIGGLGILRLHCPLGKNDLHQIGVDLFDVLRSFSGTIGLRPPEQLLRLFETMQDTRLDFAPVLKKREVRAASKIADLESYKEKIEPFRQMLEDRKKELLRKTDDAGGRIKIILSTIIGQHEDTLKKIEQFLHQLELYVNYTDYSFPYRNLGWEFRSLLHQIRIVFKISSAYLAISCPQEKLIEEIEENKNNLFGPLSVPHKTIVTNCGMGAVFFVIDFLSSLHPGLNFLWLDNTYFETHNLLSSNLFADKITKISTLEDLKKLTKNSCSYVALYIEPRSFNYNNPKNIDFYGLIELIGQRNFFHIIVDATLLEEEEEVNRLIKLAKEKNLHLWLIRSLIKFDQMGLDMASGGQITIIGPEANKLKILLLEKNNRGDISSLEAASIPRLPAEVVFSRIKVHSEIATRLVGELHASGAGDFFEIKAGHGFPLFFIKPRKKKQNGDIIEYVLQELCQSPFFTRGSSYGFAVGTRVEQYGDVIRVCPAADCVNSDIKKMAALIINAFKKYETEFPHDFYRNYKEKFTILLPIPNRLLSLETSSSVLSNNNFFEIFNSIKQFCNFVKDLMNYRLGKNFYEKHKIALIYQPIKKQITRFINVIIQRILSLMFRAIFIDRDKVSTQAQMDFLYAAWCLMRDFEKIIKKHFGEENLDGKIFAKHESDLKKLELALEIIKAEF